MGRPFRISRVLRIFIDYDELFGWIKISSSSQNEAILK